MRFSVLKHKGLYGLVQCFPITMTCHPEGNVSEWISQNKGIMSYLKSAASYRVFRKNCGFFQNSLQPLPPRLSKLSTLCECTATPIGW